jgi:hypothetical protein
MGEVRSETGEPYKVVLPQKPAGPSTRSRSIEGPEA